MTLYELLKRFGDLYLNLLNIYKPLKQYESLKEYNIASFSLNRSIYPGTVKTTSEFKDQADRPSIRKIRASLYRKKLEIQLHNPENLALKCMEDLGW
jgi:hypothetical protein